MRRSQTTKRVITVALIAADPRVTYISLDAPVRSLSHVTTTTGLQQVRSQRGALGLPDTLDGSGITIALLDSGIDARHKSFSSPNKTKLSQDFAGQNRTDDPWGHGTHVAAIAAGDGAPTSGAYEGIAPGASLLNLRVLNNEGVGTVAGVLSALDWLIANKNTYNVRAVNMILGTAAINSFKDDPICNAVRKQKHYDNLTKPDLVAPGNKVLGQNLLSSSAPAPQTTISGFTFPWTQGLLGDGFAHGFALGDGFAMGD
jgi:subtilisin family serine protease